ncbi:MAG TPA: GIY-YIG nuclease family protein [Gemmatimonadales bacterium]
MTTWHVYLIRTRHGTLYTGIATDVGRRLVEHAGAKGAKYLRSRAPLRVVYEAAIGSRALALTVEARIKRLPKARKEAIATAGPTTAELLSALGLRDTDG